MKLPKEIIGHIRMVHPTDYGRMVEMVIPVMTLFETVRDKVPIGDMGILAAAAVVGSNARLFEDGTVLFEPTVPEAVPAEVDDDADEEPSSRLAA